MPTYKAPLDDIRFVLEDLLDVGQLSGLPGYADATPELLAAILEEAAKLCEDVLAPLNQPGDSQGCRYENGVVRTPTGFRDGYTAYVQGGWPAMVASPDFGGQGLPHIAGTVLDEMLCSSNLSFSMYPLLAHGTVGALQRWGDEELKRRFLPKLVDGTWTGTMCLTEPHAGTDLGMIRTRAVPAAPAGTKGISLFLVPKRLPTDEGEAGSPNGVTCGSIEHKMGIKGNATCVINFDGATGWLVGDEHKGMRAMFTMMNGARLGVGLQGLGLAEVAYQNALAYTKDRVQGRSLTGKKAPDQEADPIIVHPDVRRMLLTQKAYIEGERALAYWVGQLIDIEEKHPDAEKRKEAEDLVALMTPIIKGFLTDTGFECANLALQCLGGHGYIREYGLEQFVRDARIAQIYEGTNGVQALDLIGRKVPEGNGRLLRRFLALVQADLQAAQGDARVADLAKQLGEAVRKTQESIMTVIQKAMQNPDEAGAASTDFLRMMGLVATGWMWLKMARVALDRMPAANGDARFYDAKVKTARFYFAKLLPQVDALTATMQSGAAPVMELEAAAF